MIASGAPPRIELIDLRKTFSTAGGEIAAVRDVSLRVAPGEVFGIIGESGAGKSTLIRLINRLERPTAGRVLVDGEDIAPLSADGLRRLRRRIGMIFQHSNLLSSKTVSQNIAFPLRLEGRLSAIQISARVAELLDRVGLSAFADAYPAHLSGGQKQRVGIARALACGPGILLCDEATSALDPETTRQILGLLAELNRELALTIVLITHEMDVVRQVCDRVAVLDSGQVVEQGAVIDVFLGAEHAVTKRLLGETLAESQAGATAPGARRVRLTWRGDVHATPFLSRIAKDHEVEFSLEGGRIARLKDEPFGQVTLTLSGANLDGAIAALRAAGVGVHPVAG